jgi:hypothetical protein
MLSHSFVAKHFGYDLPPGGGGTHVHAQEGAAGGRGGGKGPQTSRTFVRLSRIVSKPDDLSLSSRKNCDKANERRLPRRSSQHLSVLSDRHADARGGECLNAAVL